MKDINDINITVTEQKQHIGKYNITLSPKDNKNDINIKISDYTATTCDAHTLKQEITRHGKHIVNDSIEKINEYESLRNLAYNKADSIKSEIDNQIIEKGFEAAGLSKALSSQEVDDEIFTEAGFSKVLSRQEVDDEITQELDAKIKEEEQEHPSQTTPIRDIGKILSKLEALMKKEKSLLLK